MITISPEDKQALARGFLLIAALVAAVAFLFGVAVGGLIL